MKVNAINTLNTAKNISFGSNDKAEKNRNITVTDVASSNLVKVPVIVLMAMSPLNTAGADTPEKDLPVTAQIVATMPDNKAESPVYVLTPKAQETQQAGERKWIANDEKVVYSKPFTNDRGQKYTMEFVQDRNGEISSIFFVPPNYKCRLVEDRYTYTNPPEFHQLVYHNTGDKNTEFAGAITLSLACDENGQNPTSFKREIKLPDDVANDIIHLMTDESRFKATSTLKKDFIIQVNTAALRPTTIDNF